MAYQFDVTFGGGMPFSFRGLALKMTAAEIEALDRTVIGGGAHGGDGVQKVPGKRSSGMATITKVIDPDSSPRLAAIFLTVLQGGNVADVRQTVTMALPLSGGQADRSCGP